MFASSNMAIMMYIPNGCLENNFIYGYYRVISG